MEQTLAYIDHLNYRVMTINDNLEKMKMFKNNTRLCQSDDEDKDKDYEED